jgi:multicomponent Na+:H+ antiporter subunit B
MSEPQGMSPIVQVVTQWLLGLIVVFGLSVALFGHLTPGGGFAGGVVVACGFVLATLAFGARTGPAAWMKRHASTLDASGAWAFILIALLGYVTGHFIQRWLALGELFTLGSTSFVVLLNVAILLKVGAGLFAAFAAIAAFTAGDERGEESEAEA